MTKLKVNEFLKGDKLLDKTILIKIIFEGNLIYFLIYIYKCY